MNVVVGKEWLRVEMSQVVCVVVTGQDNGEQKGGLECDGRLHLQVSTGLVVQRGLCFGEAIDSVVEGSRKLQASGPVLAWVTDRHR